MGQLGVSSISTGVKRTLRTGHNGVHQHNPHLVFLQTLEVNWDTQPH